MVAKRQTASIGRRKISTAFFLQHAFVLLVGFRILNALVLRTFFQPDEFYQALEPAWAFAFGDDQGAWITWEWKHHLRSSIHPAIFAATYSLANATAHTLKLSDEAKSELLLIAPKIVQAILAAVTDLYTWKIARHVYGTEAKEAWIALLLTVGSPWNWFCSTKTFSNCLETTLTVIALFHWPFHWGLGVDEQHFQVDSRAMRIRETADLVPEDAEETSHLRVMFTCAALATILRPTNAIIWIVLVATTFIRGAWHSALTWEITAFAAEGLICCTGVLALSTILDRLFYGAWTLPAWNFLKFNVFQSIAVFYGNNNWHYYWSQGYPLMLLLAIVPAVAGLYNAFRSASIYKSLSLPSQLTIHGFALISLVLPLTLSFLSHKEVRFIYPILPVLHVIAAKPLSMTKHYQPTLAAFITVNVAVAGYVSVVHNAGIIAVTNHLRHEFEGLYQHQLNRNLTLGVLMPCHSIPWRSHLQYPPTSERIGISGWALTCEPPLNMDVAAKAAYLDEADIFYNDPIVWIKRNMDHNAPQSTEHKAGVYVEQRNKNQLWGKIASGNDSDSIWLHEAEGGQNFRGKRSWPDFLLFFEQLEPTIKRALGNSAYKECARFFNSHGHDDWRRKGDVVVWCLPRS